MRKKRHNNGYKVCYKEKGSRQYIRYFITYTYKQAKLAVNGYKLYPPTAREDNHILDNPIWKIIPIKHSEVRDGIWRDDPF